nr:hypothetical protein [Candidatus Sigynarchaeota archaeon]
MANKNEEQIVNKSISNEKKASAIRVLYICSTIVGAGALMLPQQSLYIGLVGGAVLLVVLGFLNFGVNYAWIEPTTNEIDALNSLPEKQRESFSIVRLINNSIGKPGSGAYFLLMTISRALVLATYMSLLVGFTSRLHSAINAALMSALPSSGTVELQALFLELFLIVMALGILCGVLAIWLFMYYKDRKYNVEQFR